MNIKQRTLVFIRILLALWLTFLVACNDDNPVSNKINNPPIPPCPNGLRYRHSRRIERGSAELDRKISSHVPTYWNDHYQWSGNCRVPVSR